MWAIGDLVRFFDASFTTNKIPTFCVDRVSVLAIRACRPGKCVVRLEIDPWPTRDTLRRIARFTGCESGYECGKRAVDDAGSFES
jgi:hypothetical protein